MLNGQYIEENITYLDLQLIGINEQELFIGDHESLEFRLTSWLDEFIQYWNEQSEELMEETLGCSKQGFPTLCHVILEEISSFCENRLPQLNSWESAALVILNDYHPYMLCVTYHGGQTGFLDNNL